MAKSTVYRICTRATGPEYGYKAIITANLRWVHETQSYVTERAAIAMAERWIARQ